MFWVILLVLTVAYAPCSIGLSLPIKRKWRSLIALLLFFRKTLATELDAQPAAKECTDSKKSPHED